MKHKLLAFLLVFTSLFITSVSAQAAKSSSPDNRYFIKSKASVWKNSLSVRNTFDDGFTADLSDWQLKVTKLFGVEVVPVQKLYVSPAAQEIVVASTNSRSPRPTPSAQISWNIATMYGSDQMSATSGGKDIKVAILDTGIAKDHPDLVNRVSGCKDFTNPKQAIMDGKCDDKNGHGTHVAGIIAADGGKDGKGIYGMAPEAQLLAYKVCDASGSCWADDIAVALKDAVDSGAQIINMSLGSEQESPLIHQAVNYAGDRDVLMVAAAGNDGPDRGSIDYPAANVRVVSVGALDDTNAIPDWSSRGINTDTKLGEINEKDLEFAAPGVNIESTWKDGYAILSGTSMAAPHIAGLAALLWDKNFPHPADAVRQALTKLAHDVGPVGEDNDSGYGFPTLH